jgi:hypothetical protein
VNAKVDPHRTGDPAIDRFLPVPGTFADSVYRVAMGTSTDEMDMAWMAAVAHVIIAMPEMQAIRRVLRLLNSGADACARVELSNAMQVSPALADWVRSDPS